MSFSKYPKDFIFLSKIRKKVHIIKEKCLCSKRKKTFRTNMNKANAEDKKRMMSMI